MNQSILTIVVLRPSRAIQQARDPRSLQTPGKNNRPPYSASRIFRSRRNSAEHKTKPSSRIGMEGLVGEKSRCETGADSQAGQASWGLAETQAKSHCLPRTDGQGFRFARDCGDPTI
jgi:hypothetical protein